MQVWKSIYTQFEWTSLQSYTVQQIARVKSSEESEWIKTENKRTVLYSLFTVGHLITPRSLYGLVSEGLASLFTESFCRVLYQFVFDIVVLLYCLALISVEFSRIAMNLSHAHCKMAIHLSLKIRRLYTIIDIWAFRTTYLETHDTIPHFSWLIFTANLSAEALGGQLINPTRKRKQDWGYGWLLVGRLRPLKTKQLTMLGSIFTLFLVDIFALSYSSRPHKKLHDSPIHYLPKIRRLGAGFNLGFQFNARDLLYFED